MSESIIDCQSSVVDEDSSRQENPLVSDETDNVNDTEESSDIRFYPPAYIQRYVRVRDVMQKKLTESDDSPKTILEVGSAELSMHNHLKNLHKVEKIIYMDIDDELLERMKGKVRPLAFESLVKREIPLVVEVYSGCITKTDERVLNSDPPIFGIIGIEILEHLDTDVEVAFISTLFGKYAPPVIILTTPNSDFNAVLGLKRGKFRHWDHRFELTRQEFVNWCSLVCQHFPKYKFLIEGIAEGPPGSLEEYGYLSQMAIFEWRSENEVIDQSQSPQPGPFTLNPVFRVDRNQNQTPCVLENLNLNENLKSNCDNGSSQPYKLVERIEFPWCVKPPVRERVRDEIRYHIGHYTLSLSALEKHWEKEETTTSVEVSHMLEICQFMLKSKANEIDNVILRNWLEEDGYKVEGKPGEEFIVVNIPSYEEHTKGWFSSEEEEDETEYVPRVQTISTSQQDEEEDWS